MHERIGCSTRMAERVAQYMAQYHGCAPSTFALITDELGIEAEQVFKALIGLSGGVGLVGTSSCGALIGAAAAISLSFNIGRKELAQNLSIEFEIHRAVGKVVDLFQRYYRGITCIEVQMAKHGAAFNLRDPKSKQEFDKLDKRCPEVVRDAVMWTLEVLSELKANPS